MSSELPRILVIEDDLHVVEGLLAGLRRGGFDVTIAMDGARGAELAVSGSYELVVLDLMLPDMSGFEVLEAMRGRVSTAVIVLSARSELQARLDSFAGGAVDYMAKPFFIEELVARIQARLALQVDGPRRLIHVGTTEVDLDARSAIQHGENVNLTAHEFNVLAWLVERPNRAVSRDQLVEHVLAVAGSRAHRTIDSHMSRVRKKLGEDAVHIRTVWGIGYRFEPDR